MKRISTIALVLLTGACSSSPDDLIGVPPGSMNPGPGGMMNPGPSPEQCKQISYVGFDNQDLTVGRAKELLGVDRGRVKPFTALQTEYQRALGTTPASLNGAAATFGDAPARWYEEPQSNAVALQTAFNIGFDGCLTYTATDPKYTQIPNVANAGTICSEMQRKFWSRTPTNIEVQACIDVAVTASAPEAQAQRRWAYACASVLTSAGFIAY